MPSRRQRMDARSWASGLVGFALWTCAVVGFAVGAVLLARQIGWEGRVPSLVGAPGAGAVIVGTVLAATLASSDTFGVFIFSFCGGLLGAPLVVMVTQIGRMRRPAA